AGAVARAGYPLHAIIPTPAGAYRASTGARHPGRGAAPAAATGGAGAVPPAPEAGYAIRSRPASDQRVASRSPPRPAPSWPPDAATTDVADGGQILLPATGRWAPDPRRPRPAPAPPAPGWRPRAGASGALAASHTADCGAVPGTGPAMRAGTGCARPHCRHS